MVAAFMASDPNYDGVFYTAVKTTRIFCRPGCPAAKAAPRKRHVLSHGPPSAVRGLPSVQAMHAARDAGEAARVGRPPDRAAGRGARGAHPRGRFARARHRSGARAQVVQKPLRHDVQRVRPGAPAFVGAGHDSGGANRGRRGVRERLSVAQRIPRCLHPHVRRDAGKGGQVDSVSLAWIESPLGPLIAGADDRGICLLEFSDRRMLEAQLQTLSRRLRRTLVPGEHHYLEALRSELAEYFAGTRKTFEVPLNAPGSPFQERVWKTLLGVPYGELRSYEQIGDRDRLTQVRPRRGTANGMNRIAIVIPCHRVIGKDGSPTGYGGGIWRKQRLLALERGEKGTLL